MKKASVYLVVSLFFYFKAQAQISTTVHPDKIEMAQLTTAQIMALPSPLEGTLAYDITVHCLKVYKNGFWECTGAGSDACPAVEGCCSGAIMAIGFGGIAGPVSTITHSQNDGEFIYESGNVNTTGVGSGLNFYPSGGISGFGTTPSFIAKFDRARNPIWIGRIGPPSGTTSGSVIINSIRTNGANVYVAGYFTNTLSAGTLPTLTTAGGQDGFVAKLDNAGNFIWVVALSGTANENVIDLEVAGSYVYVTGEFSGTYGGYSPSGNNVFVSRLDEASGTLVNSTVIGSSANNFAKSILIDNNKIFVLGWANSPVTMSDGTVNVNVGAGLPGGMYGYLVNMNINLVPNASNNSTYGGTAGTFALPTRMVKSVVISSGSATPVFRFGINAT